MRYREIGKVPYQVRKPERLCRALHGTGKVEDDTDQEERQRIAVTYLVPGAFKGHQEVGGTRDHRYGHTRAAYNGHGLQPPGNGAEYEMVCTDQGVEKDLRPERKYPQAVRINRFIELLGQEIIHDTQCEQHKPHTYPLVHVVALDDGLSQPVLPVGDICD